VYIHRKPAQLIQHISASFVLFHLILTGTPALATDFGNISGDLYLHGESNNPKIEEKEAFVNSHLGLKYETPEILRISLATEVRNGAKIWERSNNDADVATGTLVSQAYLQYAGDNITTRIGRQEIEQEWIEDYHEAATLSIFSIPLPAMLEIYSGYTRSIAVADEEEISADFDDIGKHGTYFLDILLNNEAETWSVHPYLLHTRDLFTGYGTKFTFNLTDYLGFGVHYAGSDVKETSAEQTSIFHAFTNGKILALHVEVGFIQAGDDGVGLLDLLGEHINPLEEGNLVFEADATTLYSALAYTYNIIELQLIFGNTDTEEGEENEINLVISCDLEELTEGLSFETTFSTINAENDLEDFSTFMLNVNYEFDFSLNDF